MILVPYDGSDGARAAIDHAAGLMPGAEAVVLTVWHGQHSNISDGASALRSAREGASRATAAGMVAHPITTTAHGDVAQTVLETADRLHAQIVVMGSGACGPATSSRAGSVSHSVMQRAAGRDVLVVRAAA